MINLPWRPVSVDGKGPPINTSLTENEAEELKRLAAGASVVVEVGAAYGYSTILLAQQCPMVISIDPHVHMQSLLPFHHNIREYGVADRIFVMMTGSERVLPKLGDYFRADLVFIDGDHTNAAIRPDIKFGWRLIKRNGAVACHDYNEVSCPDIAPACDDMLPEGYLVDTLWVATWKAAHDRVVG